MTVGAGRGARTKHKPLPPRLNKPIMRIPYLSLIALPLVLALSGCGGADDTAGIDTDAHGDGEADTAVTATVDDGDAATDTSVDALPAPAELGAAHLAPLARGLAAENAHLGQAVQRLQSAQGDGEQLQALAEIEAVRLDAIGAEAAGLEAHEYRRLRDALYEHLGAIDTRAALEAQYRDADTTGMDEATAAEARRQAAEVMAALPDPYVDMDPALAEALQQRQAELASLRATNIGLLFKAVDG